LSSSSWIFGEFILTLTQSLANINTFLRWDNNNRSFQWQVYDPPVSVYKGYSLLKDTEECLSTVGLKKPLYVFRALDLKEDMFGALTPCLFQDQLPSASMSVEKLAELEPSADTSYETCIIEFDGASKGNPGLSGAAAVLKTEDGSLIFKMRQGLGIATNNAAEYHGLILGLKHAIEKGYTKIKVKTDSKLVCMQMKGQWKVNHEVLSKLHKEAKQLSDKCLSFEISHVLRSLNSDADEQANMAARLSEGEVEVA
jgi:ribonuclease HI